MNKRIDFTHLDGLNFYQDTLDFMQDSYRSAIGAMATGLGDKLIISGVQLQAGVVSNGWITYGGELISFLGGPAAPRVIIEELINQESFADGSEKDVYYIKRARLANTGGFPFSDLRNFKSSSIYQGDSDVLATTSAVKALTENVVSLIGFEDGVIINGCEASLQISPAGVQITAGVVKLDGKILSVPAYDGIFPVYLNNDGGWQTTVPNSPHIVFDHDTTQRYAAVLRRALTPIGKIESYKTYLNYFDSSGNGRFDFYGFKICSDLRGRTMVGYDTRATGPNDGVYDNDHNIIGRTGGSKRKNITLSNLPNINLSAPLRSVGGITNDPSGGGYGYRTDATIRNQLIPLGGSGEAMDTRDAFRVVLFLERYNP